MLPRHLVVQVVNSLWKFKELCFLSFLDKTFVYLSFRVSKVWSGIECELILNSECPFCWWEMAKQTWEEYISSVNRESSSSGLISGKKQEIGYLKSETKLAYNFFSNSIQLYICKLKNNFSVVLKPDKLCYCVVTELWWIFLLWIVNFYIYKRFKHQIQIIRY